MSLCCESLAVSRETYVISFVDIVKAMLGDSKELCSFPLNLKEFFMLKSYCFVTHYIVCLLVLLFCISL